MDPVLDIKEVIPLRVVLLPHRSVLWMNLLLVSSSIKYTLSDDDHNDD